LIALLACPPALASADTAAQEQARQQTSQPGNNAPLWRQARSGAPQTTTARGVEAGVLIQSRGETWRELRPPLALMGGVLLALALSALGAFYAWRGPIATTQPPTGKLIERFNYADRLAHWTTGISFVVLAATGTVLTFGKYLLLPVLGYTLFSWLAAAAKNTHNFAGPLFALSLLYFIARYIRDNLPRRWDIDWLLRFGGMFSGAHVPSGRFNAGEKTLFWGLVCLFSAILCATGLVLDFPNAGQGRALMQSANVIHVVIAMLAIAAALFHIYLGTIGVKGAYAAMRNGTVDESWAREHHEIWYEEVKAGHSRQHFVESARSPTAPG
jgi:formate dehydrogenase subunit gamma